MKTVKVKDIVIGEGQPKVVVPMVGKTETELLLEAESLSSSICDLVEWRVDHFNQVRDFQLVARLSKKISEILKEKPLLFTFRSKKEGGEVDFSATDYFELYRNVIEAGWVDLLDVELFMPEKEVNEMIAIAHEKGIKIVMCNHDFEKTPSQQELVSRLCRMQEKKADICKIAVMPKDSKDVLTLLDATNEMQKKYGNRPMVTISMGKLGMISRVSGEIFGSAMTFGSAERASAPGQIPISELKNILNQLSIEQVSE
ncbi:type I 3-dehydroquinate dehydratase [Enterococcus rivorum]|uniref:3-dehydroquinate dehydratase n=1 Tax=Enterococcus rivorum TaxID=762845 RepID=A0A1E5KX49_9ENTE|nr:type I 3-dehydroquinate dehydratase [Enterococcus rivorum]MBP2100043.1 3-dehydroquinate dehydratase-1 [Enterococcus rivorum]OEH82239.1 3-dehydroquinate dehydratase [Enterococcus rivorum]